MVVVINAYLVWKGYIEVNITLDLDLIIIIMAVIAGHLIHSKDENSSIKMKHSTN